jgi:ribonuclease T2
MIHEYRAHGTCSGLEPAEYFAVARELYQQVRVPSRFTATDTVHTLSPEEIERAFIEANAWLKPEMLAVKCRDGKFLDLRICFGRDLFPSNCGVNETQSRLCRASRISVPPVAPARSDR